MIKVIQVWDRWNKTFEQVIEEELEKNSISTTNLIDIKYSIRNGDSSALIIYDKK